MASTSLETVNSTAPASRSYHICTRCIMDTSDPDILFDEQGVCNHCHTYDRNVAGQLKGADRDKALTSIVDNIKAAGVGKQYDCVLGVSGGVDSTYMAWLAKSLGLRPLAVHFDNGWNSETAVHNIQAALEKLGIDLITYVVDWEEFRDIQLSFLKASISNPEHPTDHAITATLYRTAEKHHIKYVLVGSNIATEGILPFSWVYNCLDYRLIKSLQRKFGSWAIKSFPGHSLFDTFNIFVLKGLKRVNILDYVDYSRSSAIAILENELGWRSYGAKHHESHYTRFCQQYIFPHKFNFDKRRAHLSSLVVAGELTRDLALKQINENDYTPQKMNEDITYVAKKFGLSADEFRRIMEQPPKSWRDYPNNHALFQVLLRFPKIIRALKNAR